MVLMPSRSVSLWSLLRRSKAGAQGVSAVRGARSCKGQGLGRSREAAAQKSAQRRGASALRVDTPVDRRARAAEGRGGPRRRATVGVAR